MAEKEMLAMIEQNEHSIQRRGSSPVMQQRDRGVDVWGERRMRSIAETPEDSFSLIHLPHPAVAEK